MSPSDAPSQKPYQSDLSDEEAARRRDELLRRLMRMPPKPQSEMKLGKPRGKGKPHPSKAANAKAKRT